MTESKCIPIDRGSIGILIGLIFEVRMFMERRGNLGG